METSQNAFVESQKKKKRKKRIRNLIILGVLIVVIALVVITLLNKLNAAAVEMSQLSYNAESVREGEISSTISGSGTLAATEGESLTSKTAATVADVYFQPGDTVRAGETIMTLHSDELTAQLDTLTEQLDEVQEDLAGTTRTRSNLTITSPYKGVVKDVKAGVGDVAEDFDYLCLIATDGKMKLVIDAPEELVKYDAVLVSVDAADKIDGTVMAIEDGKAAILFKDDRYAVGASAEVYNESGTPIGSGSVEVSEYVAVRGEAGRITGIKGGVENQTVSRGTALFTLGKGAPASDYVALQKEEADLLAQIEDIRDCLVIKAEYDSLLATLPVEAGDELAAGAALCTLSGRSGYTMTLAIDELDIASVALGQDASVTLDAFEGEFAGKVTNISYAGSGSYVTSYNVTVTTDPIEGALPGMSANVEIITQTSGQSFIVSVGAVQYDGDTAYVYLCGEGVQRGQVVGETELDPDTLTKRTVETGMSDGSYIVITGEGLHAGDLIWAPQRTTTAQYTASDTTTAYGVYGTQGGGQMPSDRGYGGNYNGERPERPSGDNFPGGN